MNAIVCLAILLVAVAGVAAAPAGPLNMTFASSNNASNHIVDVNATSAVFQDLVAYDLSVGAAIAIAIVGSLVITAIVGVMFFLYDRYDPLDRL